jgi:hypothetical protein
MHLSARKIAAIELVQSALRAGIVESVEDWLK